MLAITTRMRFVLGNTSFKFCVLNICPKRSLPTTRAPSYTVFNISFISPISRFTIFTIQWLVNQNKRGVGKLPKFASRSVKDQNGQI